MEDPCRRSKTPGQTSASDPNPTATFPSASALTGDATTASLLPFSASPSAPPTTTTTTQIIPSAPPQTTSLLPSSPSQITATTKPFPWAPPPPIRKAHQERICCTSGAATTTDLACRSTAPSASVASLRTPTLLPITDEFMSHFAPAVAGAMAALQSVKEEDPAELQEMVAAWFCSQLDKMESVIGSLLAFAEKMKGDPKLKAPLVALFNLAVLESAAEVVEMLFAERKKRHGSGGSCGGSEGEGSNSESDGEGGGVSV
ncbi:mucin-2-like [Cocos nucifera]|uniref:Mucin-2-like n=1 Tax=Cocos nucifera TaxID=13894 RepID=A0A8K0IKR4_COCNU|nr:mucin-2-like [Cocos nucifera]